MHESSKKLCQLGELKALYAESPIDWLKKELVLKAQVS